MSGDIIAIVEPKFSLCIYGSQASLFLLVFFLPSSLNFELKTNKKTHSKLMISLLFAYINEPANLYLLCHLQSSLNLLSHMGVTLCF